MTTTIPMIARVDYETVMGNDMIVYNWRGTAAYNKRIHGGEIMLKSLLGFRRYIHVNCNGMVREGRYPEDLKLPPWSLSAFSAADMIKRSGEMCGRFTLVADLSVVEKSFHIQEVLCDYKHGNNISPAQQVVAVIRVRDRNQLVGFRWGLIPGWAKDPAIGNKMFNARAETVADKPSSRSAFKKRRCLIIADGFYEWSKVDKKKVPYHFALKSGESFGFAGLYETWISPENKTVNTCTIITTDANELLRPILDRMPVIVTKEKEALWIDPGVSDQRELEAILKPYPAEDMKMTEGFLPLPKP